MKKKLTLLLALVLLCASVLTACSKSSDVTGTVWELTGGEMQGQKLTSDLIELAFGKFTYEFNKDGVLVITIGDESVDASWTQDGSEITIKPGNGNSATAEIDGNKLTMMIDSDKMVFTKK